MSSGHAELLSTEASCLARVERGASQTAAELRRSGGPSLQDRVTGEKLEKIKKCDSLSFAIESPPRYAGSLNAINSH